MNMMYKMNKNFSIGLSLGLSLVAGLANASIPGGGQISGKVTDDTLIYDNLREISVKKEHEVNFDSDLSRLSAMERHYKEQKLPKRVSYQVVSRKQKTVSRKQGK